MEDAPLFTDVADGPDGGRACWVRAADGTRLRIGHWPAPAGDVPASGLRSGNEPGPVAGGTVLLFPGRTEYIEKYGPAARTLARSGWGTLTIDWRGQGLSDRTLADRNTGHVDDFGSYQHDVAAMVAAAQAMSLPLPHVLLAHSMGGCIGLRALTRGLVVSAAAFSAPMWGMRIAPGLRPVARVLAAVATLTGQGHRYAPGTGPATYVTSAAPAGNALTTNEATFLWMKAQADLHPELALGGPSFAWAHAALRECRALSALPSPSLPVYCALGTDESVVATGPVHDRIRRWPGATLDIIPAARHEVMMEKAAIRDRFFAGALTAFGA